MIITFLQYSYWPAWHIAAAATVFTAALSFYYGCTVIRHGSRAPAPESRLVAILGWAGFLSLLVVLTPAIGFFSFWMPHGVVDFVHDPATFKTSLSILGGVRTLAGNEDYTRFLAECLVFAAIGGRGIPFAMMMWPRRKPAPTLARES